MTSDEIFEIQAFYFKLFKGYSILSEDDIRQSLLNEEFRCKKISWNEFGKHIEWMRNSLPASSLSSEKRQVVLSSLARQQEDYEMYFGKPEARMIMGEGDRESLVGRRYNLMMGNYLIDEQRDWKSLEAEGYMQDWRSIPKRIIEEIEKKIKVLNDRLDPSVKEAIASPIAAADDSTDDSEENPAVEIVQSPQHTLTDAVDASDEFGSLFELGFTIVDCNILMKKLHVGANFNSPSSLNAKIWALLDVLNKNRLLNCSPIEAAPFAGRYFNTQMPKKPSSTRIRKPYKQAIEKLTTKVKEDMADKKYGPNRA